MNPELVEKCLALRDMDPACRGQDLDWWFEPPLYPKAKKICAECPAKEPCLEYAMEANEQYGVWGGVSPEGRRKLRKARRQA